MATPESIAIRRSNALDRAEIALHRVTTTLELDVEAFPEPHKRTEMRPALEAEWLAGTLEAVADKIDPNAEGLADALDAMTRAELNGYANELGVADPDKLPNKAAVIAAIKDVETATAPEPTDGTNAEPAPTDDADPGGEAVTEAATA